jgi:hypothetical protein
MAKKLSQALLLATMQVLMQPSPSVELSYSHCGTTTAVKLKLSNQSIDFSVSAAQRTAVHEPTERQGLAICSNTDATWLHNTRV